MSRPRAAGHSGRSRLPSSGSSPAIALRMSIGVVMPSISPYSSVTTARCVLDAETDPAAAAPRSNPGCAAAAPGRGPRSSTPRCTASLRFASVIMPSRLSNFSRAIRKRAWPLDFACCHSTSIGSSMSSQITSWRGIMIEPTLRSASASTPSTRRRSEARNTPARVPSATQRAHVVFRHRRLRRGGDRQDLQERVDRHAQQPDARRRDCGEQTHDRCDAQRERFGVQQGDALGHQLADDRA